MPRVEVDTPVTLYVEGYPIRAYASDISQGGMKIRLEKDLPIDCDVTVNLPGLAPEAGTIRWKRDDHAGIVFNRLMPLSGLVAWLHEQRDGMRKTG
nr:PilZ domain-containing protein [Sphingomicrobium sp. B8]